MSYSAAVITCSDRAAASVYEDRSGPVLREALAELGFEVADGVVVPDHPEQIRRAIQDAVREGARVIFTTGGTGISPTDLTVEITRELMAYEVPGLMEEVRRVGSQKEPRALLSRGLAAILALPGQQRAIIVNAPGSRGGARDSVEVVGPLLHHIVEQLDGSDHPTDAPGAGAE
ncbi:MogA/MoaB family molybdenum cofactor biosynthesis protein [Tessaracoccus flavus]|nr:MogA/MoaB family molybdenum cofactor biosynthesis protein [Tessaracoccus flavus]SDY24352.1 molybdopterin adenylyltransferase [Tessaracoccus flavus]